MRYLFRGLIRETGKTVEGAVDADTPEDALNALSANGIVTEDLTPAPMPVSSLTPSARAQYVPRTAGAAGPPPLPPGMQGAGPLVPAENIAHPGLNSADPVERAFAAASQAVSFDAVAQRYRGKSVWVIDRDKIRRQVATIVDQALKDVESRQQNQYDGDAVRETVASALKEMFKDNRNIASQQTPEQARGGQVSGVVGSSPQLDAQILRLEDFLVRAETVLTQLQVAAKRLAAGGGGGFAPRRMSHIPRPRGEEQNEVLLEIFRSNVKLRQNLARARGETYVAPAGLLPDEPEASAASAPAETEPAQTAG